MIRCQQKIKQKQSNVESLNCQLKIFDKHSNSTNEIFDVAICKYVSTLKCNDISIKNTFGNSFYYQVQNNLTNIFMPSRHREE